MPELPRQSDGDDDLRRGWEDAARGELEVEIINQPPGVRFFLSGADCFHDALDVLNNLEFVELRTRGAGHNDGRRLAVHHSRIVGLYDPEWEMLPEIGPLR